MAEEVKHTKKESFYISKRFMPEELKNSSFAPSDRWILTTVRDTIKKDTELRTTIKHTGLFAFGALSILVAGITAIALTVSAMPFVAGALAISAIAGTTAFSLLAKKKIDFIKSDIAPRLKPELAMLYAKMQASQMKDDVTKKIKDSFKNKKSKFFSFSLKDQMKKAQAALSKESKPNSSNANGKKLKPNN